MPGISPSGIHCCSRTPPIRRRRRASRIWKAAAPLTPAAAWRRTRMPRRAPPNGTATSASPSTRPFSEGADPSLLKPPRTRKRIPTMTRNKLKAESVLGALVLVMVEGKGLREAARTVGVHQETVRDWVARFRPGDQEQLRLLKEYNFAGILADLADLTLTSLRKNTEYL